MSVVVAFEDVGPWRKKLTIEVPAPAVEAEMGRVVNKYRQSMQLPGFRKGKVPASLVRQRFRQEIENEVLERLVPRYWRQAQAEKDLDPLLPPQIEQPELEAGQALRVVASVETRPDIELGSLEDFELPQGSSEPTPEDVEDALTDLRRHHAQWIPVERAAGRGDLAVGKIRDLSEDGAEAHPLHLELGGEGADEELTLALTGLAAGQGTEVRRTVGEGEEAAEHRFQVDVEAVKEQELPEIDDAFAERVGKLASVEELRQAMASNLRASKQRDLRQRRESAMLEQLRQRHPLELPQGVVQHEAEQLLQEYAEGLASRGVDVENAEIDWEALAGQVRPQAERRVHDRLLLDAVSEARQLRLDETEFEQFLAGLAAHQKVSSLSLRQKLSDSGRLESLRADLLRQRTVRHLLGEDISPESESDQADQADQAENDQEA